jgi:hypothetical protein
VKLLQLAFVRLRINLFGLRTANTHRPCYGVLAVAVGGGVLHDQMGIRNAPHLKKKRGIDRACELTEMGSWWQCDSSAVVLW